MRTPLFSIAIPTRNRPSLARMATARVLSQDFADFEIIILDNSDQRDLTTAEFNDSRCRVVPTTTVLSMRDNWERTLGIASGKYVMILSDKDMLLPGALRRLAEAFADSGAHMINFRKACYASVAPFQSFVQLCSGHLVEKDGRDVLRAWFEDVQHYHDAPMIYNSAVRRDVLTKLRAVSGSFFAGASPDIGSGMVLLAHLNTYHVLDRPLAVSWFGNWSIGMATSIGSQGAAAIFLSEYQTDPFRDAGLVTCLSGSVAETALACKARFSLLLQAYHIKWSAYIYNVLGELKKRQEAGIEVDAQRRFVMNVREKKYSWLALRIGQAKFHWNHTALRRRLREQLTRIVRGSKAPLSASSLWISSSKSAEQDLVKYFGCSPSTLASFRNVPSILLPWASSVNDIENFATMVNNRLDDLVMFK